MLVAEKSPQKQTSTYAKFDLDKPALNFSIQSNDMAISQVNHFGIEVNSSDEVTQWQKHLETAGIISRPEEDVSCCFALQDKVWFQDPDGNAWEVFYIKEQLQVSENKEIRPLKKVACGPGAGCC